MCFPGEGGFMFSFFFFSFWPPKWSWPRSHIPVNPSLFSTQWVTPGGLYPQFLHVSANTCTHIHAHIPGPMPISHALPRLNTARGSPLCPSSYPFPAQEGISSQKHPETARMNTPPQAHKTRTGLPTHRAVEGVLKGKIQQHQSHGRTQHHGDGWVREEIKIKKKGSQVGSALSSPGSPGVWGWFRAAGQVSVELLGQWAVGLVRGRAGRGQEEVGTDRGSRRPGYTYHSFLEMKDPSF